MDNLTPEEQSLLDQFAVITNFDQENELAKVKRLLVVCNWNLEIAIARYFDNDFPELLDDSDLNSLRAGSIWDNDLPTTSTHQNNIPISPEIPSTPYLQPPTFMTMSFPEDDPNSFLLPKLQRAFPINNKWKFQAGLLSNTKVNTSFKYNRLLTPLVFLLMLMPRMLLLIGYGLNKLFGNFAPKLFKILGLREEEDDYPSSPLYNSIEDINNCNIENYIKMISGKPDSDLKLPKIFNGDFNKAFDEARNNFKWFCIILFNSKSVKTSEKLVKDILINEAFVNFIEKNDIVLYIGDVSYPEPFEVGQTYNAFGIPYLSLIANVSVTGFTYPEFSIVTKYSKILNQFGDDKGDNLKATSRICKRLDRIIGKYEPQLISQRFDKQEAEFSRLLREEQDNAYQDSLLKDMAREQQRKNELREEELLKSQKLKEEEELKLNALKKKECIIKFAIDSYDRDSTNWKKGEFTNIQFRRENGQRFIKKFYKDDTVNDIFMFVLAKEMIDQIISEGVDEIINNNNHNEDDDDDEEEYVFENENDVIEYLRDYKFKIDLDLLVSENLIKFQFDLVSPMPRLRLIPGAKPINDVKEIWPNGSLLVEKNDNDNDDDDESAEDDGVAGDNDEN